MFLKTSLISCFFLNLMIYAQQLPKYPELTENLKRVNLNLPKISNTKNIRVEIAFGTETKVSDCQSVKDFSFNGNNLKQGFGLPNRYMYYYISDNQPIEITAVDKTPNCNSKKVVTKKVISYQNVFLTYDDAIGTPFFIPKNWTIEYKIWKTDGKFKTIN